MASDDKPLPQDFGDPGEDPRNANDGPPPLPILLRIPWFPPAAPPPVVSAEVCVASAADARPYPLVIQRDYRAVPVPPSQSGRRKGWILALVLLAAFVGGIIGWQVWPDESGEESPPAVTSDATNPDGAPAAEVPAQPGAPPRAAHLSPEIIPIDPGESP
jgi:hypothetical protein